MKTIYETNLIGNANVITAFHRYASPNTSAVIVTGVSSRWHPELDEKFALHLATSPVEHLLQHENLHTDGASDYDARIKAYALAERATQLRVEAAACAWGHKGARINSSTSISSLPALCSLKLSPLSTAKCVD